ncbi:MAG: ATP-binding cassette domain-containing protein [Cyclobacteriaceae bacterium]|nr:ATP-binding cassette domain-containing protein [Cyclobacteriaceae bacterium]
MEIILENLGKRYQRQWIFKNINLELSVGKSYAVTGPNGSGKSTLVKVLMGVTPPSIGHVKYLIDNNEVEEDSIYQYCSLASPYLDLIEEFTLQELIAFHFKFKKVKGDFKVQDIIEIAYLEKHKNKLIKNFSSGMKQRLKLALAFYSDTPVLFLDEPTSNLDTKGIEWYLSQVSKCSEKMIIVASNQSYEFEFCENHINIPKYI